MEALKRQDDLLCEPAAAALVKIQADPEQVIPALIACLVDSNGHGRADVVEALGEFGPKSKAAVPVLVKLLGDHSSKELVAAVPRALRKIDTDAAAKAGVK
jgi:HEAT repeat protein